MQQRYLFGNDLEVAKQTRRRSLGLDSSRSVALARALYPFRIRRMGGHELPGPVVPVPLQPGPQGERELRLLLQNECGEIVRKTQREDELPACASTLTETRRRVELAVQVNSHGCGCPDDSAYSQDEIVQDGLGLRV